MTPPKAKDGRETLQERLRKMVMPVSDQAYPVCIEAADAIDAAQAEIARLEEAERVLEHNGFRRCDIAACNCNSWHFVGGFKARFDEIKQVVEDAGYSTNGRTLLDAVKHMAKDATPFPVAKDVVERITDPIERTIADALLGANVPFTSEKGGTHRLDFGLGDGVFVEVKQFYTPRADSALQKNENVILIQGRRAAEKFASLLRQPAETESLSERREENEATGNTASEGISPSASRPVSGRSDDPSHEADTHAANVSLGVTAGETAPSRQPEAAPEGLIRNAALQEAAAHLRDMGYWTQASAVLSLCTNASAPTPASAVANKVEDLPDDLEVLREVETNWLAEYLNESIARLGYPVGCGNGLNPEHAQTAARTLFDRYLKMIALCRKATPSRDAGLEEAAKWHDERETYFLEREHYFAHGNGYRTHCRGSTGAEDAAKDFKNIAAVHRNSAKALRALIPGFDALKSTLVTPPRSCKRAE